MTREAHGEHFVVRLLDQPDIGYYHLSVWVAPPPVERLAGGGRYDCMYSKTTSSFGEALSHLKNALPGLPRPSWPPGAVSAKQASEILELVAQLAAEIEGAKKNPRRSRAAQKKKDRKAAKTEDQWHRCEAKLSTRYDREGEDEDTLYYWKDELPPSMVLSPMEEMVLPSADYYDVPLYVYVARVPRSVLTARRVYPDSLKQRGSSYDQGGFGRLPVIISEGDARRIKPGEIWRRKTGMYRPWRSSQPKAKENSCRYVGLEGPIERVKYERQIGDLRVRLIGVWIPDEDMRGGWRSWRLSLYRVDPLEILAGGRGQLIATAVGGSPAHASEKLFRQAGAPKGPLVAAEEWPIVTSLIQSLSYRASRELGTSRRP